MSNEKRFLLLLVLVLALVDGDSTRLMCWPEEARPGVPSSRRGECADKDKRRSRPGQSPQRLDKRRQASRSPSQRPG